MTQTLAIETLAGIALRGISNALLQKHPNLASFQYLI